MADHPDALTIALRQIADENGLTRIDIGTDRDRVIVTGWYPDGAKQFGACSFGHGTNADDAIDGMLADKAARVVVLAEAA